MMLDRLFGLVLLAHGAAHVVGFLGPWRLVKDVACGTTILSGRVDVGEAGAKMIGILWLLVACGFVVIALGAFLRAGWWPTGAIVTAAASLALCVVGWPDARTGLAVNVVILTAALAVLNAGWGIPSR
jgi:hypothetical protein